MEPLNEYRSPTLDTPVPVVRPASMAVPPHLKVQGSGVPSQGSRYEHDLVSWLTQAIQEGESLNASESVSEDVEENIRMVMGDYKQLKFEKGKPAYLSSHIESRVGKNLNDIASAITDFRPTWHYKTYNSNYERQGEILDKLSVAWWYNQAIDLKLQLLVKQSLAARTGYAYVCFNPTLAGGQGDLDIIVKDYRDVLPIRPNSKITIQDAFGVAIKSRNTVNWAKARYGSKAAAIKPTTEGSFMKSTQNAFRVSSPALDYLDSQRNAKVGDFAIPLYDHYEIYIRDNSINSGGERVWVGPEPAGDHPWGYWVEPGKPLYPRGRLIVAANLNVILFDGGNPYWHGMFPVAKLTLDPMPWSFLGKSALADAKQSQFLVNEMLQGIVDASRKALRPGIIADKTAVGRELLQKFDSREPGWKLKTNPSAGQGIVMEVPQPLPDYVMALLARTTMSIDFAMGVTDMRTLEQLKQVGGATDVEALLEYLGPSIRQRGRVLEVFLREVGEMMKSNFFQFYTLPRRVQILGKDGLDMEDYDFDPGTLVPQGDGERSDRAMEHAKNFTFFVTPNSLLNLSKRQDQLLYLQLFTAGVIDPVTLLEKLDVPNIGELPGAPTSIIDRMSAAGAVGFTGAVSSAGRKAGYDQLPALRPDGKMSTSG